MGRLDSRVEKLEQALGVGDRVTHIECHFVEPTPDGPRSTGDVLVWDIAARTSEWVKRDVT